MVFRFIKFDDEMTVTTQQWSETWQSMRCFELSKEELDRRRRIALIHIIFWKIKSCQLRNFVDDLNEFIPVSQLISMNKRDMVVWKNIYHFIQNKWVKSGKDRLKIDTIYMHCLKCKALLGNHYVDCRCRICSIAGGPCLTKTKENSSSSQLYCKSCLFYENIDKRYINYITKNVNMNYKFEHSAAARSALTVDQKYGRDVYHLSWAVFRHLAGRRPYPTQTVAVKTFCIFQGEGCMRMECRVASHIVAAIYPLNFSILLMTTYQPVDYEKLNVTEMINHLNERDIISNICSLKNIHLTKDMSLYAEYCLTDFRFTAEEHIYPFFQNLFFVINKDIELHLTRLENIYAYRVLLPTHRNIEKKIYGKDTHNMDELRNRMDELAVSIKKMEENIDQIQVEDDGTSCVFTVKSTTTTMTANGGREVKKVEESVIVDDLLKVTSTKQKSVTVMKNTKFNRALEAELKVLKKEHSDLKDKVRDLKQKNEIQEKIIQTKSTQKSDQGLFIFYNCMIIFESN